MAPGALEAKGVTLNDVIVAVDGEDLWGVLARQKRHPFGLEFTRQGKAGSASSGSRPTWDWRIRSIGGPSSPTCEARTETPAGTATRTVGLVAAASDPKLAETAWQRALAAGAHATAFVWRLAPCWPLARAPGDGTRLLV